MHAHHQDDDHPAKVIHNIQATLRWQNWRSDCHHSDAASMPIHSALASNNRHRRPHLVENAVSFARSSTPPLRHLREEETVRARQAAPFGTMTNSKCSIFNAQYIGLKLVSRLPQSQAAPSLGLGPFQPPL